MSTLQIPQSIYQEIIAHSRQGKPEEICGILPGSDGTVRALLRAQNVAEDRINNYSVDNQNLLRLAKLDQAGELAAIYHSHPISVAYPSATDAWNAAYPDPYYVICSLEYDDEPVVRAFRLVQEWIDVDWEAIRAALSFYETRPGLFAYYQAEQAEMPSVLALLSDEVTAPFYLVYSLEADDPTSFEGRVVTVREDPIVVTD